MRFVLQAMLALLCPLCEAAELPKAWVSVPRELPVPRVQVLGATPLSLGNTRHWIWSLSLLLSAPLIMPGSDTKALHPVQVPEAQVGGVEWSGRIYFIYLSFLLMKDLPASLPSTSCYQGAPSVIGSVQQH